MFCHGGIMSKKNHSGNREVKKPKQKKTVAAPATINALAARGATPPGRKT
jgi:hypothetical protein